ncbi:hypothetical protein ACXM0B_004527, partial [Salmonella enterica subsp. enterica serovar Infantis]
DPSTQQKFDLFNKTGHRVKQLVLRARGDACPRIKQKNRLKNGWKTPLKKASHLKVKISLSPA